MAELEERVTTFLKTIPQLQEYEVDSVHSGRGIAECGGGDTFAERAEWFFKKRPELLNLLKELYNSYISLKESKHQRRHSSSLTLSYDQQQQQQEEIDTNWDIESSLSNQTPDFDNEDHGGGKTLFRTGSWIINSSSFSSSRIGFDEFVTNLVIKNVEGEILRGRMGEMEQQFQECWRKMEILKKLIEVLESERVILVSENSRLGHKVGELMEENKGLESEVMFLKRKAGQLSRCVMKMREDHSVCMLTRKIEDLQTQINGLMEKRNKGDDDDDDGGEKKLERGLRNSMGCFQSERLMMKIKRRINEIVEGKRGGTKWWDKVKKGIHFPVFGVHGFSSSTAAAT